MRMGPDKKLDILRKDMVSSQIAARGIKDKKVDIIKTILYMPFFIIYFTFDKKHV